MADDVYDPEVVKDKVAGEPLVEFDARFAALLTLLARSVYGTHVRKGFHSPPRTVPHLMGMVATELSEIIENDRNGVSASESGKIPPFNQMEEEVADAILRLLDFAGLHGLDVGGAVLAKARYNEKRPHLHGKRY